MVTCQVAKSLIKVPKTIARVRDRHYLPGKWQDLVADRQQRLKHRLRLGLGLADGIVDLVETGTTMRAAGLEEVSVIMHTETVLIANPPAPHKAPAPTPYGVQPLGSRLGDRRTEKCHLCPGNERVVSCSC